MTKRPSTSHRLAASLTLSLLGLFAPRGEAVQDWNFTWYPTPANLPLEQVRDVKEGPDGEIWVVTWGGGVTCIHGVEWGSFDESIGFPSNWNREAEVDSQGGLWVVSPNGLFHIRGNQFTNLTPCLPEEYRSFYCVARDPNSEDRLWLGTSEGQVISLDCQDLLRLAKARNPQSGMKIPVTVHLTAQQSEGKHVKSLLWTRDGRLWAGMELSSCLVYDGDQWSRPADRSGILPFIELLFEDASGTVWGSGEDAVYRFEEGHWVQAGKFETDVHTISQFPSGEIVVGCDEGIRVLEKDGWRSPDLGREVGSPHVYTMTFSRDGAFWVGSFEGLIRGFEPSWKEQRLADGGAVVHGGNVWRDPQGHIHALSLEGEIIDLGNPEVGGTGVFLPREDLPQQVVSGTEETLWLLYVGELIRFDALHPEQYDVFPLPEKEWKGELFLTKEGEPVFFGGAGAHLLTGGELHPIADERVHSLVEVGSGEFFVSFTGRVEYGPLIGDRKIITDVPYFQGKELHLKGLCLDREERLWMASYGDGVYVWDGKDFSNYSTAHGLQSNHVCGVFEARDGEIWITYRRRGVASFKDGHWISFDNQHGLPSSRIKQFAEGDDGTLWIAPEEGPLHRFPPDHEGPETFILAGPEEISTRSRGIFSFIGMDAWNKTRPENLHYSWRILNTRENQVAVDWSKFFTTTTVAIPRLDSGSYRFEVRTVDDDRNVDPTPASFVFQVPPPFWVTPHFYVPLCFLGFLVILASYGISREHEALTLSREELLVSESRLQEAQRIAQLGYWTWRKGSREIEISEQSAVVFGLPKITRSLSIQEFRSMVHPADIERFDEAIGKTLTQKKGIDIEFRILRPEGDERSVQIVGRLQTDDRGNVNSLFGTLLDITERKKSEEERIFFQNRIQETQKMESLGVLAGGIAHDFNNLLLGILGNASLALMDLEKDRPEREYVQDIETAATRAAELTNQMLAYSGKGKFVVAPVNLSKLVQEMSRLLESALSKNVQFDFDLTKDLPLVEADPTQMRQVVMNLMTNAAESMSEGPGRVRIRTGTTKLDKKGIKALRWGGDLEPGIYAFIEISDTGCGMNEETLKRIFDPFFTTKFTGRGLGLAATLGIVRGHHGAIQVKSEEGRGTTFTLWFPIIKKPTTEPLEPEPAPRDWRLKGKILVADDEETVRAVVERSLAKCGFEIIMAKDGDEALERFVSEEGSLSAILLDLSMPRRNGLEVLEEIRKVNSSIPVLVSSGYASEEFSDRFAEYGVSGFIQKPYVPAALVRKLEEILQGQKV